MPALKQLSCKLGVPLGAIRLEYHVAVMREAEPVKTIEYGLNGLIGRSGAVCVFDTKQKFAAGVARIEPIEQCRSGAADMKKSGW